MDVLQHLDPWIQEFFQRGLRALLVDQLRSPGGVRGGALSLLGSVLEWYEVAVALSGLSVVEVHEGVPEGGLVGPPRTILYKTACSVSCGV